MNVKSSNAMFKCGHHFVKHRGLGRLIGRMENAEQPIAPSDGCARWFDAVIPIVLDITVAATALLGRRVAKKSPEFRWKFASSCHHAYLGNVLSPPLRTVSAESGVCLAAIHSQDGIASCNS